MVVLVVGGGGVGGGGDGGGGAGGGGAEEAGAGYGIKKQNLTQGVRKNTQWTH